MVDLSIVFCMFTRPGTSGTSVYPFLGALRLDKQLFPWEMPSLDPFPMDFLGELLGFREEKQVFAMVYLVAHPT